jgi:hypothetical protein
MISVAMSRKILGAGFSILFILIGCRALSAQQNSSPAPAATDITEEEYRVYAAVLESFRQHKHATQPLVADHTSTFSCEAVCNGMHIGGCNGLRDKDETPAERLKIVQRDLPQLTAASASDFQTKNQKCSAVEAKIPAKARYSLFGQTGEQLPPVSWDHADFFFFSRVGFSEEKTLALVYVGFMSGTNAKLSEGRYFLFLKENGQWKAKGSSAIWKLQP